MVCRAPVLVQTADSRVWGPSGAAGGRAGGSPGRRARAGHPPKSAGMKERPTASSGATSSMLKPARLRTERRIMPSATRMKARGMGSRCSSVQLGHQVAQPRRTGCPAPGRQARPGGGCRWVTHDPREAPSGSQGVARAVRVAFDSVCHFGNPCKAKRPPERDGGRTCMWAPREAQRGMRHPAMRTPQPRWSPGCSPLGVGTKGRTTPAMEGSRWLYSSAVTAPMERPHRPDGGVRVACAHVPHRLLQVVHLVGAQRHPLPLRQPRPLHAASEHPLAEHMCTPAATGAQPASFGRCA